MQIVKQIIIFILITISVFILWILSPLDGKNIPFTLFNSEMTFHSRYLLAILAILLPWVFYMQKCVRTKFGDRDYNILLIIYNSVFTLFVGGLYFLMIVLYLLSGTLGYFFPETDKVTGKPIPDSGISLSSVNVFFSISLLLFIALEFYIIKKIKRQRQMIKAANNE